MLLYSYKEKGFDRDWEWLSLPPKVSPFLAGVFPLVSKDGLPEKAKEVFKRLKRCYSDVFYDDRGSIGKRYARADEIGTPICITIDYQTLEDDTVTLRNRDTTEQIRVKIDELVNVLWKILQGEKFENLRP